MTTTKDTTKADAVVVFKQDGLGRVRMPAARREQLLDEFERSGLSGKKFAALAGIKYQTFATWAQKRRRQTFHQGCSLPFCLSTTLPVIRLLSTGVMGLRICWKGALRGRNELN